jgi:endonuclease YncB( thermonuclease family)
VQHSFLRVSRITAIFLSLFLLFSLGVAYAGGKTLQAKVMKVKDGDTIVVAPEEGGEFITCRLYGIDAPETASGVKTDNPMERKRHQNSNNSFSVRRSR